MTALDNEIKLLLGEGTIKKTSHHINENKVISIALRLCSNESISLNKNPSFNANTMEVVIKPQTIEYEKLSNIKQAFDYSTGCSLIWTL